MQRLIRLIRRTYWMAGPQDSKVVMHNVAFLSALQAVSYLLPIIIIPYLFRVIGPSKFGLVAFAQALVQYFMIITDYGFSITATKEISICQHDRSEIHRVFSSVMTVKFLLSIASLVVLSTIIYCVPKFRNDWMVYIFGFGTVVGNSLFPIWFFQGIEQMKYIANINILGEFLLAVFIFMFVKGPDDYLMVPLINSLVFMTVGLLSQYIVFRKFGMSFKFPGYKDMHQQLKAGWNLFISVVAINAYTTTRVFLVGLLTNNTITGFYSIAERIANVAQTFPLASFSQAVFPRLSKIYHKNKLQAYRLMEHIQLITIIISVIILPIIFLFTPAIVQLACGGYFKEVVLTLRLLLVSVFFVSANAFRVQFLLVCGKTVTYSRIHVLMALLGLPLILSLISVYGYVGAAMATVAIEAGIFATTYIAVKGEK